MSTATELAEAITEKQPTKTVEGFKGEREVCFWCEYERNHPPDHSPSCPVTLAYEVLEQAGS